MRRNRIRIDQQATYNTLAKLMLGRRVSLAISLFAYLPLQFPRCPVSKQSTHTPITITIMSSPSSLLFLFFFHSSSHYTLHTTTLTHITIYIHTTHTQAHFLLILHTDTLLACLDIIDRPHAHSLSLLLDCRAPASARARSSSRQDQNSNEEAGGSSGGEQLQCGGGGGGGEAAQGAVVAGGGRAPLRPDHLPRRLHLELRRAACRQG